MKIAFGGRAPLLGAFTLCVLAAAALAGCGGSGGGYDSTDATTTSGSPPPSPAPTISGTPATQVTAGQAYSFTPTASGPSGTTLSFSIANMPSWAAFSTTSGKLSGTPSSSDVGTFANIAIRVSDGSTSAALPAFNIQVAAEASLTISGTPSTQVTAGQAYSFTPTASGPAGLTLTFSVQNLPSWATFSATTGKLSGTPASSSTGTFSDIVISVSDGQTSAALPAFNIQVNAVGVQPPTISGTPATSVSEGQAYSFTPTASGPSGLTLTFSITNLPSWASFSTSTGTLSGTPASSNVGTFSNIIISVSDGQTSASLPGFNIQVNAVAPTISGTPATSVNEGQAYSFTPTASGPSGLTLTFSVQNLPSWATFNTSTGTVSGTPSSSNVGTFSNIVITVSDGQLSASLSFSIQVKTVAPTISGTPATTVTAGQAYSFTPTASGPSGLTLTFSVTNLPSWASFSTSTGALTGTPASSNVGTFSGIVITVSDGQTSASLASFSIQVQAAATVTISGTPATQVTAGQAYSFTPTASGPSGTTLTYSVQNLPAWAAFNTSTGALTGTPSSSYVGTFSGIVISVSDGSASASLAAFSIQVNAAPSGSASLSWVAPTTNTDGSTLTNLAGYIISYGTSETDLSQTITVSSATATSYTVTGLSTGTWYFTVAAYTSAGEQSAASNMASDTIS